MENKALISNLDKDYKVLPLDSTSLKKIRNIVNDESYYNFLYNTNGGFFYNSSLQIYSCINTSNMQDIFHVNNIIHKEYGLLAKDLLFFGQEIFGNQFAFSDEGIMLFNIESGDREIIAPNFGEWCVVIENDLDYYTGKVFSIFLNSKNMGKETRLCPKIPFITGGSYEVENFYSLSFPRYIQVNFNIAKQVHLLPDGSEIKFEIIE